MINRLLKILDVAEIERISFRQDINGLRSIAVLSVVLYHAEIEIFKGGWLGVDIFFVISGYLISNIIISELNEGNFSFKNFYLRRIKRILPALFSTIVLTLPFAYFLLTQKALEEYVDSIISSLFFYANYYFMNLDFYVAESTKFMPLLHTWSLAIEEQYYILFPFFAYLTYRYFKKYFTFFIGFLVLASLYLNTLSESSDKFYRLEFRVWELLLGVLVMILSNNIKIKHLEKIGFPLMLFSIYYFGDNWINDSEPKIIALLGVSLIIFSNTKNTFLSKVLNLKIISMIGLSSYSIYLLHQPLFAFYRRYLNFYDAEIMLSTKLLLFVILLIISYINFQIIEKPFLDKERATVTLKNLGVVFLVLILFSIIFKNTNLINSRFTDLPEFVEGRSGFSASPIGEVIGSNEYPEFIIVGDSHTMHLLSYMSEVALLEGFSFIHISESACFSFINYTNFYNPENIDPPPDRENCYNLVNVLISYINQYDVPVIFANTWSKTISEQNTNIPIYEFNDNQNNWSELINLLINEVNLIKQVTNSNSKWFIVGKNPGSYNYEDGGYFNCLVKNQINISNVCEKEGLIKNGSFYFGNLLFETKLKNNNELIFINPYIFYCDNIKCSNLINEELVYTDHHHFTYLGSKPLVDGILNLIFKVKTQ